VEKLKGVRSLLIINIHAPSYKVIVDYADVKPDHHRSYATGNATMRALSGQGVSRIASDLYRLLADELVYRRRAVKEFDSCNWI